MSFARSTKRVQNAGILCLLTMSLISLECSAQSPQTQTPTAKPLKKGNFGEANDLKQKVSLNGLPEYAGKQIFVTGKMQTTPIGPQYRETFIAMEPPSQVLDWYKGALTGYKWQIVTSDAAQVYAKKPEGSSIIVTVSGVKSTQGRTMVKISFHDYHVSPGTSDQ
jgi:hypothetical protein